MNNIEKIENLFNQLENGEININQAKNFVIDLLEKETIDMDDFFDIVVDNFAPLK